MTRMMTRSQARALGTAVSTLTEHQEDVLLGLLDEQIGDDVYEGSSEEESTVDMDEDDDDDEDDEHPLHPLQWAHEIPVPKHMRVQTKVVNIQRSWWNLFVNNIFWSTFGSAMVLPLLIYRWKYPTSWPMQCRSYLSFILTIVLNWLSLLLLTSFLYASTCDAASFIEGRLFRWPQSLNDIRSCVESHEIIDAIKSCIDSSSHECLVNEDLYLPVAQFVFIVIVATQMVLRFYSSRVKSIILMLFVGQYAWKWYGSKESPQSSRKLTSIEPNFVFAKEPIFVLLDGENLNEGAQIGWVPYWSCAEHSSIINCPVVHSNKLYQGGVSVTFTEVDEYIPCYYENTHEEDIDAQPTNIATHMYECFESHRLVVKHQKSQPGWSLHN